MNQIVSLAKLVDRGLAFEDVETISGTWWEDERALLREIIRIATEADARGGKRERAKPYTSGAKRAKKARATK
jgi:hypothetical protein